VRDGSANRRRHSLGPLRRGLIWPLLALIALAATSVGAANDAPSLDLAAYKGRVVVVDFWASWCTPCRRSIPWLNQMRAKYGDRGLVVIGVNVDKDGEDAARFLREVPIDFDVVYDPAGELAAHYGVEGMPSTYVYSRDGALVARHLGFQNAKRPEYEALLGRLLQ
jgi:cytochrome c biogenesis protein CcmG/thiol:disulfide interchange protein DsbE